MIINIDSKIPNLALKKIEKYHLDRGDEVIWDIPLFQSIVNKTYVSCIFDWNRNKCLEYPNAEVGGSGLDVERGSIELWNNKTLEQLNNRANILS